MSAQTHSFSRPHFHFNPKDEKASSFAQSLIKYLGQFEPDQADAIINVGGDGTVIRSFHMLPNLPNFAVRPPESNSALFTGHCNITTATDLKAAFEAATLHSFSPLKADIELSNGEVVSVYAYQDIVANSFNAQAVLSNEHIDDQKPQRIMGCGWIIATPLGSTAINETRGGKVLDLDSQEIVVTIDGVSNPVQRKELVSADHMSRVVSNKSVFEAELSAVAQRRESRIDYDSDSIMPDGQRYIPGQPITIDTSKKSIRRLRVSMDHGQKKQLLLNQQYRTPGFN